MHVSKLSLNVISLSGLALGVGMLVDNSIVVLDNIFKKRDIVASNPHAGKKPYEAITAIEGSDEMLLAITASTLTTVIVFLPLIFINPEIQRLYSGIALTITYSLLASLITALTIVPLMLSKLKIRPTYINDPNNPESFRKKPFVAIVEFIGSKLQFLYKIFISLCLLMRYLFVLVAIMACIRAFAEVGNLEKEFIGIAEQNKFTVFIEMPTGTKIDITNAVVAKVEEQITKVPEIKTATSKVEQWSSKIFVELQPFEKRKLNVAQVIEQLRPIADNYPPAFIYFEEPEEVGTKEIVLEIFGYDYEKLKEMAMGIAERIGKIPKFTDTKIRMREGRPEYHLTIDKSRAALFGLNVENIALALHTNTRGLVATRYRGKDEPAIRMRGGSDSSELAKVFTGAQKSASSPNREAKETETIVRLEEQFRNSFEALRRTAFVGPDGNAVYLHQIAGFETVYGPSEIWRKNKSRMVQVSSNTGGTALGTAADKVKEALKNMPVQKDYFWQIGGNYEKMLQNQVELTFALIISLVLVYMLLASLFESFTEPIIILLTVPLAAIGAIAALRYTNKPVGTGVLIGAIMLGGIVVNNAIVLVDRINFLRSMPEYMGKVKAAVIDASFDRLRPILMTSLTTILGLIPLAFDKSESANLWAPLAITVIGGMTVSTFLTLYIIPGVYMIFHDFRLVKR
jgi:HAE1 family hydrophobic/amphiphilic exporter-1